MKKFLLGFSAFILPILMYLGFCISGFARIDSLYVAVVILILFFVFDVLYIPIEMILKKKLSLSTEEYNISMFTGGFLSVVLPILAFMIISTIFDYSRGFGLTILYGSFFVSGWIASITIIRLVYEAIIRIKNRIIIKNNSEEEK